MSKYELGTAAGILAAVDLKTERFAVPEWDCDVILREFDGIELSAVSSLSVFSGDSSTFDAEDVAKVCVIAIRDEAGNRMFTDEQAPELAKKNMRALMRIFSRVMALSQMTSTEVDEAKKG